MKIQLFEIDACFTKVRVLTENNLICVSATLPDLNWDHFQKINYQRLSLDCLALLTTRDNLNQLTQMGTIFYLCFLGHVICDFL